MNTAFISNGRPRDCDIGSYREAECHSRYFCLIGAIPGNAITIMAAFSIDVALATENDDGVNTTGRSFSRSSFHARRLALWRGSAGDA